MIEKQINLFGSLTALLIQLQFSDNDRYLLKRLSTLGSMDSNDFMKYCLKFFKQALHEFRPFLLRHNRSFNLRIQS